MLRVVHYLNQFFGAIGAEEKAGVGPTVRSGAVGPGLLIDRLLAGQGTVVATLICGDNYFNEHREQAEEELLGLLTRHPLDIFIAGPAFNAGRYGLACGAICMRVKQRFGVPVVTGMFHENPGAALYKKDLYIISTTGNAAGMGKAMPKIVDLSLKLYRGGSIGKPDEEGYIPRGMKSTVRSEKLASERAIELLLKKMRGEPFQTEIPFPDLDVVPSAPPVSALRSATIALVTEGGLVPKGNPDKIESARATKYASYSVVELEREGAGGYHSIHRGIDTTLINEEPNRLLPVDVLRELEREGAFGKLHGQFLVTTGVATTMQNARKIGEGIARELLAAKVSGVILTAT
jgi:glycine reductase complex component B subunit gamma